MKWRQALVRIKTEQEGGPDPIQKVQKSPSPLTSLASGSFNAAMDPQIHPWNDDQVHDALMAGHLVWVWSRIVEEWVIWVLGEKERAAAAKRHPYHAVYTLDELRDMTRAGWTPEHLQKMHQAKRALGGALSCD